MVWFANLYLKVFDRGIQTQASPQRSVGFLCKLADTLPYSGPCCVASSLSDVAASSFAQQLLPICLADVASSLVLIARQSPLHHITFIQKQAPKLVHPQSPSLQISSLLIPFRRHYLPLYKRHPCPSMPRFLHLARRSSSYSWMYASRPETSQEQRRSIVL